MKMLIRALTLCSFFVILTGCASSPSAIQPLPVPDVLYANKSCAQLAEAEAEAQLNVASLSQQQSSAVTGDAVGVFMIGMPVSSMTGGDVSGKLAEQKGRVISIKKARAQKRCPGA